MKVILLIWISAVFVREVVPGTIMRHPRELVPEPESHNRQARHVSNPLHSSVQTEYEAMYQQKGHHGNESFSTVKGKQEIVHDNCSDNWNDFAEKCATLIKDLVASLANAISSSPGDTTNLQLQIKNSFRHFDSTNNCSCFNETKSNISKIGLELPLLLEKTASLSSANERSQGAPQGAELSGVGSGIALRPPLSKSGNGLPNAAGNQRGHESGCTSDCDKEESGKGSSPQVHSKDEGPSAATNNQALPVYVVGREPQSGQTPQILSTQNSFNPGNLAGPSASVESQEIVTKKPNLPPYFLPLDYGKDAIGKPVTDSLMVTGDGHHDGSSTSAIPVVKGGAAMHPSAVNLPEEAKSASTNDDSNCDESENGSAGTPLGTGSNEFGSQDTSTNDHPNLSISMQASEGSASPAVTGPESGHASREVPSYNGNSATGSGNAQNGGQSAALGTSGEVPVQILTTHSGAETSAVEPPRDDDKENSGVLSASQQNPEIMANPQVNVMNASPAPVSPVQTLPVSSSNIRGIEPVDVGNSRENSSVEPPSGGSVESHETLGLAPATQQNQGIPQGATGSSMPAYHVPASQVPASQTPNFPGQVLPVSSSNTVGSESTQSGLSGENLSVEPPCEDSEEGHENSGITSTSQQNPGAMTNHQVNAVPAMPVPASNTAEIEPIHEVQAHTSASTPQTANLGAPVSSGTKEEESSECDEKEANESNNSVKLPTSPLEHAGVAQPAIPGANAHAFLGEHEAGATPTSETASSFGESGTTGNEDSGHTISDPIEHANPPPTVVALPNAAMGTSGTDAGSQSNIPSAVGEEDCDDAKTLPSVQAPVPQTDGQIPDKIIGFPDGVTGQSGEISMSEHQIPTMIQKPAPVESLSRTSPDITSGVVSSPAFVNTNSKPETKSILRQPHTEGVENQGRPADSALPSHVNANVPTGVIGMTQQPQSNPQLAAESSLPEYSTGSAISPLPEPAMIPIATIAPSVRDNEPSQMWANEPKPVVMASGEPDSSEGGYELTTSQRPTTFQTTSVEPTPPQSLVLPTSSTPTVASHPTSLFLNEPNSAEVSSSRPLTIPGQSKSSHHDDDDEDEEDDDDCCSCESCADEEINPHEFRTSACRDLEQAKRELKAIFDKIKKKLKCGRRTTKAPSTITLPTPSN